jgi:hypothetical protein
MIQSFTHFDRQLARAFKIDLEDECIATARSLEAERDGALELAAKAFRQRDAYHRLSVRLIWLAGVLATSWPVYFLVRYLCR